MNIGIILKRHREQRGETQTAIALRAGSDTGNLSRIERGQQNVSVEILAQLCAALKMSMVELFLEVEGEAQGGRQRAPLGLNKETREVIVLMARLGPRERRRLVRIIRAKLKDKPADS